MIGFSFSIIDLLFDFLIVRDFISLENIDANYGL